jgi:hypothetical protein
MPSVGTIANASARNVCAFVGLLEVFASSSSRRLPPIDSAQNDPQQDHTPGIAAPVKLRGIFGFGRNKGSRCTVAFSAAQAGVGTTPMLLAADHRADIHCWTFQPPFEKQVHVDLNMEHGISASSTRHFPCISSPGLQQSSSSMWVKCADFRSCLFLCSVRGVGRCDCSRIRLMTNLVLHRTSIGRIDLASATHTLTRIDTPVNARIYETMSRR